MQWLNLKDFGIEFKRVELSNNEAFPAILITDLEKYKQSGAMPLEQLNGDNPSGFVKLGGTRKGRDFNTPIYFLTSAQNVDGNKSYKITPSIAKLLNIPKEQVAKYQVDVDPSEVVVMDAYGDFDRLNAGIQNASLAYTDNTIYMLKRQNMPNSLSELYHVLSLKQHELFPKSNLENIPFDLLSKFGYGPSIIKTGFLNPMDAKQHGYNLSDLEPLLITADNPILPVSFNANGSINLIPNLSALSQLAYSNFKWEKNLNLIHDYNSLIALRESSRTILNARPSSVKDAPAMDMHLNSISVLLQNFNESNTVSKSYKSIKYNNKGVLTYIAKNENDEWRLIEKEGPKKTDLPLGFENYKKVIARIADYNTILTSALQMQVKTGAEFNAAMQKVMSYHQQLYHNHIKEVDQLPENPSANRLYINHSGSKVTARQLKQLGEEFSRDMGESLYTEAAKAMLGGMRRIENAGDIHNLLGGTEVGVSDITKSVKVIKAAPVQPEAEQQEVADIGLSILDSYAPDLNSAPAPFKRETPEVAAVQNPPEPQAREVVLLDQSTYRSLPRKISANVDANHAELNGIYQAIQHIELSSIPWWENVADKIKSVNQANTDAVLNDYVSRMSNYLEKGGDQQTLEAISNLNHDQLQSMDRIKGLTQEIETYIQKEHFKASILRYQFTRQLQGVSAGNYGILAFKSNSNGEFQPFDNKTDYQIAVKQLKNTYAAENEENNGLVPLVSDVRTKLDAFVNIHYASLQTPIEPSTDAVKIARDNALIHDFAAALPVVSAYVPPLNPEKINQISLNVFDQALAGLVDIAGTSNQRTAQFKLDSALIQLSQEITAQSAQIGGLPVITDHPRINAILDRYLRVNEDAISTGKEVVTSPDTGVPLSMASKVATLAYLHQSAAKLIEASGYAAPQGQDFEAKLAAAQNTVMTLNKAIEVPEYQETLSAQFLIQHQNGLPPVSSEAKAFGISIDSRVGNYAVRALEDGADSKGMTILNAKTYSGAVREAFVTYQMNRVAEDLGISPAELAVAGRAAQAVKNQDAQAFANAMRDLTGTALQVEDLAAAKLVMGEKSGNGNNQYTLAFKDAAIEFSTEYQAKLAENKVALVAKLADLNTPLQASASPVIAALGDLSKFELVQKYLSPDVEEKALIIKQQAELQAPLKNKALAPLVSTVTDFAHRALFAKEFKDLNLKNTALLVATNIPQTGTDLVYSRALKADWVYSTNLHFSKFNYNLTAISADFVRKSETHAQIKKAVAEHMESPDAVFLSPSIPKINPVVLKRDVDADLRPVLTEGAHWNTHLSDVKAQVEFVVAAAKANFEHAIRTAPDHLREAFSNFTNQSKRDLSQTVNIGMTKQEGTNLPRMALIGKGDQFEAGYTPVEVMTISSFMQLIKGEETRLSFTDKFKFDEENKELAKFHNLLLAKSGFDPIAFNQVIVDNLKDTENHLALAAKLPEKVTISEISDLYWTELKTQLESQKATGAKGVYVQLSSDPQIPTIKLVDSAAKPNTLDLSAAPQENLREFLTYQMIAANILLNPMIVDAIQPVTLPTATVAPSALFMARQNFIEQISANNKEQKTIHSDMSVFLVDTAVLLARTDKNTTELALAATPERIKDLSAQGYEAIITDLPDTKLNQQVINPLGLFIRANYADIAEGVEPRNPSLKDILNQFAHAGQAPKADAPVVEVVEQPVPVMSIYKDVEQVIETVEKQKQVDADIYRPTLIASQFADKFKEYDAEKIATMNVSTINKEITKDNLWKAADLERHLSSGHQQLDTLVLGLALRDALPNRPILREDGQLQTAATGYSVMVKEVYDVVAGAKTVDDILSNFNKAYRKITAFDPDLLKNDGSCSAMMLGLKKAAYEFEQQGVPASEALENNLKKHKGFITAYEDVMVSVAQHEKLYSSEKSFTHYMNGFSLNAQGADAMKLSDALLSRLQTQRIPTTFDFEQYEINKPVLHANKQATIDARSSVDFDSAQAVSDLNTKWGVSFTVSPADKHLEQGYISLTDKILTEIQKNTGLDEKAVGSNLKIFGSHPAHLQNEKADIYIVGVDGDFKNNTSFVSSRWFGALLQKVEQQEKSKMTLNEQAQLADLNVLGRGLVHMMEFAAYTPKTDAARQLHEVHEYLKKGDDTQRISGMEKMVSNSLLLLKTKKAEFQESKPGVDDIAFNYASFVIADMQKKQAEALKSISEKMKVIAAKNPDADDFYPFKSLEKQYDKVVHVSVPSSDAMIAKFLTFSNISGKDEQAAASLEIKQSLETQANIYTVAQDVMAANARHGIIQLIQEHAPAQLLSDPEVQRKMSRDMGDILGENLAGSLNINYSNDYAYKFMHNQEIQKVEFGDSAEDYSNFKPVDALVYSYLIHAVNGDSIDDKDKAATQKFMNEIAKSVYQAECENLATLTPQKVEKTAENNASLDV